MAILTWPNIPEKESVCIICGLALNLSEATAVSTYADGRPALAHDMHRFNKVAWITETMSFERSHPLADVTHVPRGLKDAKLYEPRHEEDMSYIKSDLCWHLLSRSASGRTLIVASQPIEFLSTVRKHWKKLTRQLHIERARTLEQPKISNLDLALERLHSLTFSASLKHQAAEIVVLTTDDLLRLKPAVATAYICQRLNKIQHLAVTKLIKPGGVIVDYFQHQKTIA